MTQATLFDGTTVEPNTEMVTEQVRRASNTDRVFAFFCAREGVWIQAIELEAVGGRQAWRTRVSDCRKRLERARLGTIENTQRRTNGVVTSLYRFVRS